MKSKFQSRNLIDYFFGGSLLNGPVATITAGLPTVPAGYEYRTFSLDGSNGPSGKGFLRMQISEAP